MHLHYIISDFDTSPQAHLIENQIINYRSRTPHTQFSEKENRGRVQFVQWSFFNTIYTV